jgi:uroporphyrinogen III methyltransferase/synthase
MARTTLAELDTVELGSPAVIVVGEVAGLDLEWLTGRPLAGMTVVVTRPRVTHEPADGPREPREEADQFSAALVAAGARVLHVPAIQVVLPEDGLDALRKAAAHVGDYDWVAFTSANAVRSFVPLLRDGRDLRGVRLAAVGAATSAALADHHLVADLVPEGKTAAGLAAAMIAAAKAEDPARGSRVLFPRAADAREELPEHLRDAGWRVDDVIAYRTVGGPPPPAVVADQLAHADVVTFASPSAVVSYLSLRDQRGRRLAVPPAVACIGPVTAQAAKDGGLTVAVESASPSASGLVTALAAFRGRPPSS